MPFVQVADVTENLNLVENTKQMISVLAQPMSVFVPQNTVVVTLQGSIGRVALTQYNAYFDRTLLIFDDYKIPNINKYYWCITIQNKFDIEKQKAPGGTIKTITKEALSNFDINVACPQEQSKIGLFFSQLNNLITLHQRE